MAQPRSPASEPRAPAPPFDPARVRELRGAQSRAAFARVLGVTPHTIYRWELPDGAAEARRPRGTELRKLWQLVRGEQLTHELAEPADNTRDTVTLPSQVGAPSAAFTRLVAADDVSTVLPALERLFNADLRRAHGELVELIVKQHTLSADARALARFGIAVAELLARSDPRAALLVISPALIDAEAGLLAREVEGRVFAAAALLHALPDGSLFDIGRVHAHAARVEALARHAGPEGPCLSCLALLCAATVAGDRDLLERAHLKLDELGFSNLPPLLELHIEEFLAIRPKHSGKTSGNVSSFESIAERAEQHGYHVLCARVLGHAAQHMLDDLTDPESVLAVARRARQIGKGSRIAPGMHGVLATRAEIEALLRLGRIPEAFAALGELDTWSAETGMVPVAAVPAQARLLFLTGRHAELGVAAGKLRDVDVPGLRPLFQAYAAALDAVAVLASAEDPLSAVAHFEQAEREAQRWPALLRYVMMHRVIAHIVAQQAGAARMALRRAQRYVDLFPSAWVSAHLRRLEGTMLASEGQWAAARQLLESAIATFDLAQDLCDAALCRHVMAVFGAEFGDATKAEVEATRGALTALGIVPPRALSIGVSLLHDQRQHTRRAASAVRLEVEDLIVPIRRLSARGVAAPLILRELTSIVASLFPERGQRLEELDSSGSARAIAAAPSALSLAPRAAPSEQAEAEHDDSEYSWLEFGDGSGRLLRVGVSGELDDHERSTLSLLVMTASLALEAATLRGGGPAFEQVASDDKSPEIPGFVAASPEMRRLRTELVRLAGSRATVIITGESGSGKELVARAIHALSQRADKSYVPFNCSTVPRDLFEGQLFGYRRGAFTGASNDHPGVIRAADGGTLFLDEIGELPLDVQPKLLRFLENAEVFPLGEQKPIKVDVRVLAATHRDLMELVREGRFREDLYYRLQVVPIHVPPLRSRQEDIPLLARYFLRELTRPAEPPVLAPDALSALLAHPWRGNVRELRNVIERALAFSPAPEVLTAKLLRLGH
jgi:hydrogenase-4 transcriptional activator